MNAFYEHEKVFQSGQLWAANLSAFFLAVIGFFIFFHKKFDKHPYKLIAAACLGQSIQFFMEFQILIIFLWNLPVL